MIRHGGTSVAAGGAAGGVGTVRAPATVRPGSIAIMGGSFDPIHLGHLAAAEEAREALGLERVLFVPAGVPPHKPGGTVASVADRVAMVEVAIAGNPAFELSRLEVDRPGPSFTADTVDALATDARRLGRAPDLTVILSAETFRDLPTWHEPARLLRSARIAVVPRAGYPATDPEWIAGLSGEVPDLEDRVDILDGPSLDVSSTEIRARVAAGRSIRYLVPAAVADHIARSGLYIDRRTARS